MVASGVGSFGVGVDPAREEDAGTPGEVESCTSATAREAIVCSNTSRLDRDASYANGVVPADGS